MPDPKWPFEDDPNDAVITVRQVVDGGAPILHVSHDPDDWQFLPGGEVVEEDVMFVSLEEIIELDDTIGALADLPIGWEASRTKIGAPWTRKVSPPED